MQLFTTRARARARARLPSGTGGEETTGGETTRVRHGKCKYGLRKLLVGMDVCNVY